MSLSIDIVIVVRNKSCMMQCLVGDILVQSRVEREREITWATILAWPLASWVILDNLCASVSCKSVI